MELKSFERIDGQESIGSLALEECGLTAYRFFHRD